MNKTKTGVLCAAIALCGSASAASWRLLVETADQTNYIDVDSIKVRFGHPSVWVKFTLKKPKLMRGTKQLIQSSVMLELVNCDTEQTAFGSTTVYSGPDLTGDIVKSWGDDDFTWTSAIPDTSADAIVKILCPTPDKKP